MTYREKLQECIAEIERAYDDANAMRDRSYDHEVFSRLRKALYEAMMELKNHDNRLTDGQARSEY